MTVIKNLKCISPVFLVCHSMCYVNLGRPTLACFILQMVMVLSAGQQALDAWWRCIQSTQQYTFPYCLYDRDLHAIQIHPKDSSKKLPIPSICSYISEFTEYDEHSLSQCCCTEFSLQESILRLVMFVVRFRCCIITANKLCACCIMSART